MASLRDVIESEVSVQAAHRDHFELDGCYDPDLIPAELGGVARLQRARSI